MPRIIRRRTKSAASAPGPASVARVRRIILPDSSNTGQLLQTRFIANLGRFMSRRG
jgi:hypothetical protein